MITFIFSFTFKAISFHSQFGSKKERILVLKIHLNSLIPFTLKMHISKFVSSVYNQNIFMKRHKHDMSCKTQLWVLQVRVLPAYSFS